MKKIEEAAIEFFGECRKKVNYNGMFCVLSKDGTRLISQLRGDCHASLANYILGERFAVATFGHPMKDWNRSNYNGVVMQLVKDNAVVKAYYDWLINRCIFSEWFLPPTSVDFALEQGFIISCEAPSNVLAWLCMATRWPREHYRAVRLWYTLSTVHGFNEDLAYFVAFTSLETETYETDTIEDLRGRGVLTSGFEGHRNLLPQSSLEVFRNFMDRKVYNLNASYSVVTKYAGVDNLFSRTISNYNDKPWQRQLAQHFLKKNNKLSTADTSVPNPFKVDASLKEVITWNQFLFEGGKELLIDLVTGKESIIDT